MQRVRVTEYGLEVVLGEPLHEAQAEELLAELAAKLPPPGSSFGVLVDARRARAYSTATQAVVKRAIQLLHAHGMRRRAVLVTSPILTLQSQRLARETGTLAWTRYFHAVDNPAWHQAAMDWLLHGIDPDAFG
jgi:hypothetical protein